MSAELPWQAAAITAAFAGLLFIPRESNAQQPDSARAVPLNPVVVTVERMHTPLATATAAVTRIPRERLRELPVRSVAEAIGTVPGLTFLDVDGTGFDPQVVVRGFYGGGEAEYMLVLLDGQPLNGLETGLFDWDLVPLAAVESIEVVRGGTSSLYGDAALGGVINLVTSTAGEPGGSASLAAGQLGTVRGSLHLRTQAGTRPLSFWGAFRQADGFRAHSHRSAGSAGGTLGLLSDARGSVSVSTLHHWRTYDEPGPLTASELGASRTASHPFYRLDSGDERLHRLALDARRRLGSRTEASGYLAGELRALDAVRTLPLSPEFADSKERVLSAARVLGSMQLRLESGPASGALLLGSDWSAGRIGSEHYQLLTGDAAAFEGASGQRGELDASGAGARLAAGLFARYELRPGDALRLTAGGRADWLRDSFEAGAPAAGPEVENTHVAFSPQAGLNLRWLRSAAHEGHVFVSVGRSFKAPTLDQLFDQRSIPVPFEPFRLTLSNPGLEPQHGLNIEAGFYHHARLVPDVLSASLSLAAYQADLQDELDVDLQTYRYVNIGRSRHRGIEAGLELAGPRGFGAHAGYTLQAVTFRYGEHDGNALKAIPRHAFSAGVRAGGSTGLAGSLVANGARGIWLDDANRLELPGFARVDGRLSYPLGRVRLELEVFNVLDSEYSTTGYPDPAGTGTVYYYPAAGRVVQVGLSGSW